MRDFAVHGQVTGAIARAVTNVADIAVPYLHWTVVRKLTQACDMDWFRSTSLAHAVSILFPQIWKLAHFIELTCEPTVYPNLAMPMKLLPWYWRLGAPTSPDPTGTYKVKSWFLTLSAITLITCLFSGHWFATSQHTPSRSSCLNRQRPLA